MMSNPESSSRSKSCCSWFKSVLERISLEPVLFVQNALSQMVFITSQRLMVQKTCLVNYDLPSSTCGNLHNFTATEAEVHDTVSEFLTWRTLLETALKFMVVMCLGPVSDRMGRRLPLIWCLLLLMGESVLMLVNALMPSWSLQMMYLCSVSYGLSGGHYALLMLAFSHIADASTADRRTFRMGFLDSFWYCGSTVGLALQPILFETWSYVGVFSLTVLLYFSSAVYVYLRLPRRMSPEQNNQAPSTECCTMLQNGVKSLVSPRPGRGRTVLLILMGLMIFDAFAATGEMDVKYLFITGTTGWSSSQYSFWSSISSGMTVVCALITFPLLTRLFTVADEFVGALGAVSRLAANITYATLRRSSLTWYLYLGSVLGSFSVLPPVAIRSLVSKIAVADVGTVLAVMACLESLVPLASGPLYLAVYRATNLTALPGCYYFISVGLHGIMALVFGGIYLKLPHPGNNPENEQPLVSS